MMGKDTIYALSSGNVPSGIAVIRFTGPMVRFVLETMCGFVPIANRAGLISLRCPKDGELLDRCIVLYFKGPRSFTGEDCGEFQVHGGLAVVNSVLESLSSFEDVRAADAGEFTRRAFENGRLDLTEVEGLADIIAAKTDKQLKLALNQSSGSLRELYENWRSALVQVMAAFEAQLDFSDEDDVPDEIDDRLLVQINNVAQNIGVHLDDQRQGEIIRDGFDIAIMGPPNSGKSSLINTLSRRDVAIVSSVPGTTRDIIDVQLDISGFQVNVSDTAGIRQSTGVVENIGIDRAINRGLNADLIIWLSDCGDFEQVYNVYPDLDKSTILPVYSKSDLIAENNKVTGKFYASTAEKDGLDQLFGEINSRLTIYARSMPNALITRQRHRELLKSARENIVQIGLKNVTEIELLSEHVRLAANDLGRIVGKVDIEDILDVLFQEFCIGK